MQLVDKGARFFHRDEHADPERILCVDESSLGGSGHVREDSGPLCTVHNKRPQQTVLDERQRIPDRREEEIEPTGDDLVYRLRSALEWNVHGLHPGTRHEAHRAEMSGGADAGGTKIHSPRLCLRGGDKVSDRLEFTLPPWS